VQPGALRVPCLHADGYRSMSRDCFDMGSCALRTGSEDSALIHMQKMY